MTYSKRMRGYSPHCMTIDRLLRAQDTTRYRRVLLSLQLLGPDKGQVRHMIQDQQPDTSSQMLQRVVYLVSSGASYPIVPA